MVGSNRLQNCLCQHRRSVGSVDVRGFYLNRIRLADPLGLQKGGRSMNSTTILSIGIIALICVGGIWLMEH